MAFYVCRYVGVWVSVCGCVGAVPISTATRAEVRCGGKVPYKHVEVLRHGQPLGSKRIDAEFKRLLQEVFTTEEWDQRISPATIDEVLSYSYTPPRTMS